MGDDVRWTFRAPEAGDADAGTPYSTSERSVPEERDDLFLYRGPDARHWDRSSPQAVGAGYAQHELGLTTLNVGGPGDSRYEPPRLLYGDSSDDTNEGAGEATREMSPQTPASTTPQTVLRLWGELEAMAASWTHSEWAAGRRIVQFWIQRGATFLDVSFAPFGPHQPATGALVSCIYSAEHGDWFITSVDIIVLLELIVGARFAIEEKNRIRRNLERFRPLTIAKGNPDSERFFRLIMGFPDPKPRNIEKDIKVFPWRVLPAALRKILPRYSIHCPFAMEESSPSLSGARSTPIGGQLATSAPAAAAASHNYPPFQTNPWPYGQAQRQPALSPNHSPSAAFPYPTSPSNASGYSPDASTSNLQARYYQSHD